MAALDLNFINLGCVYVCVFVHEKERENVLHNFNNSLVTPACLCGVVTGNLAQGPIWNPEKYNLLDSMELPTYKLKKTLKKRSRLQEGRTWTNG